MLLVMEDSLFHRMIDWLEKIHAVLQAILDELKKNEHS